MHSEIDKEKKYVFVKMLWPPYDAAPTEIGSIAHYDKTETCAWRVYYNGQFSAGFTEDRFAELYAKGFLKEEALTIVNKEKRYVFVKETTEGSFGATAIIGVGAVAVFDKKEENGDGVWWAWFDGVPCAEFSEMRFHLLLLTGYVKEEEAAGPSEPILTMPCGRKPIFYWVPNLEELGLTPEQAGMQDLAQAFAVVAEPKANGGILVYAKYRDVWEVNPWSTRFLIRELLERAGIDVAGNETKKQP